MDLNDFIECIRIGVIAGAYDSKYVINLLGSRGYNTTRDVPVHEREGFMIALDRHANE